MTIPRSSIIILESCRSNCYAGANPQKCFSFFKVGGGFKAEDYANIRHHTDGKWVEYDSKKPPTEYLELGGGHLQHEKPDVWIKPEDSVVVSVKAASIGNSDQFRTGVTLRFPRFKRLRMDRTWDSALSQQEFFDLKSRAEQEQKEQKEFKVDRRRSAKKLKRETVIAGNDQSVRMPYSGQTTQLFEGLNFCVLSEMLKPVKKSKAELEQLLKANGGSIFQSATAAEGIVCIADKKVVKVASLIKAAKTNVVRGAWVLDAIEQANMDVERGIGGGEKLIIPFEPSHMFFVAPGDEEGVGEAVDQYGDSYGRDIKVEELKELIHQMPKLELNFDAVGFRDQLTEHGLALAEMSGRMFNGLTVYVDGIDDDARMLLAGNLVRFAGGTVVSELNDDTITHVVAGEENKPRLWEIRKYISKKLRFPRVVLPDWIEESWEEGTLLDEERYSPIG
jgi:DNA ligase-4